MELRNKQVLVLGAGISGIAVAKVAKALGAKVTISDNKAIESLGHIADTLNQLGIELIPGTQSDILLQNMDMVIPSPGISIYHHLLQQAIKQRIEVISEVEFAYRLTEVPFIAITGTNGKTTTTTLVGEILKNADRNIVLGGNIGIPLSEAVYNLPDADFVVAEISSFQLEGVQQFRPYVCAVLNLTPDHIDRHGNVAVYQEMKERIFAQQYREDYLILNYDDEIVRGMADRATANVVFFSNTHILEEGAFLRGGYLVLKLAGQEEIICAATEMGIRGGHNVQNALAACAIAKICNVPTEIMAATLRSFKGVEHRLELVGEQRGVKFYNDSKATNPESSIVALQAFTEPVVLIAGGRDKGTDLGPLMTEIKGHVRGLILLGEAAERFEQAAKDFCISEIHRVAELKDAVLLAARVAKPGESVLLSPACASYDMFSNFEERGRDFKRLVTELRR